MHLNSRLLFEKYAKHYFKDNMKILEIGPDDVPSTYMKCIKNNNIRWDTIDISPRKDLTYVANNEYSFPIKDNVYNIVISGQVVEHVRKIWIWIKELSRVCKPSGYVIIINPVSYPYHEAPFDCWRIYPEGMRALYEEADLDVIFSTFKSLEGDLLKKLGYRYIIPGTEAPPEAFMAFSNYYKDIQRKTKYSRVIYKILKIYLKKITGYPITSSIDTITTDTTEALDCCMKLSPFLGRLSLLKTGFYQ